VQSKYAGEFLTRKSDKNDSVMKVNSQSWELREWLNSDIFSYCLTMCNTGDTMTSGAKLFQM